MNASKLRLYHHLQVAAHAVRKDADRIVSEAAGITTAQAAVLTIVAAEENVTQREVATALRLIESAVTAMATRLRNLGMLKRIRSGTDNRAWCLRLSSAGQAALRASRKSFASINARVESEFTQHEIKQLVDHLNRLTTVFKD